MESIKANFHIHSHESDGIYSPKKIVRSAKRYGLSAISVTDHNEIKGSVLADKYAQKEGIIFIPGIELMFLVRGKVYEVLAYFYNISALNEFYQVYRFQNGFAPHFKSIGKVVEMIHQHNGVAVAPHPYGRKGIFRRSRNRDARIDGFEIVNAYTVAKRNRRAAKHKPESDYVELGAADMHFFPKDMVRVYTEITSKTKITKKAIWSNLKGESRTIGFAPIGSGLKYRKLLFQKPLCVLVYTVNYPRLYLRYRAGKRRARLLRTS